MKPYPVDVRALFAQTGSSLEVSDPYDLGFLRVGDEEYALIEPASVQVTVSNAGTGLVVYGGIQATLRAACSRCLVEFELPLSGDVEGVYSRAGEVPIGDDGTGVVDAEGRIDLAPALVAALVVEMPVAPLHDPACLGLCPTCGIDLNTESCSCDSQVDSDHPFARLRDLLDSDSEA